ncbi:MAG: hypothetical protein EBZ55_00455 [Actinobacteria bacterium]|nr:hypothetical protein [Actinomycetota bacterium]
MSVVDEPGGDGITKHDVCARSNSEVDIGAIGDRNSARVDHDQLCTRLLCLGDEWQEMGVARPRVPTPDHEKLRVDDVERIRREHPAESPFPGGRLRARADRLFNLRAPKALEEVWHETLLVDARARRVVEVGNHASRPRLFDRGANLSCNERDRFIPRRLAELPLAFRPDSDQRSKDPLR